MHPKKYFLLYVSFISLSTNLNTRVSITIKTGELLKWIKQKGLLDRRTGEQGIENFQRVSRIVMFQGPICFFHVRETNHEANTGRRCRQFLQLASSPRCFHPPSTPPRSFSIALSPKVLPASNSRGNSRSSVCSRTEHYYQMVLAHPMFPPVYCTQLCENIGSDVAYSRAIFSARCSWHR